MLFRAVLPQEFSSERCGSKGATVNLDMAAAMKEGAARGRERGEDGGANKLIGPLPRPFFYQLVLVRLFVGHFVLMICLYIDYFFLQIK